jgi:hypothetical protein
VSAPAVIGLVNIQRLGGKCHIACSDPLLGTLMPGLQNVCVSNRWPYNKFNWRFTGCSWIGVAIRPCWLCSSLETAPEAWCVDSRASHCKIHILVIYDS